MFDLAKMSQMLMVTNKERRKGYSSPLGTLFYTYDGEERSCFPRESGYEELKRLYPEWRRQHAEREHKQREEARLGKIVSHMEQQLERRERKEASRGTPAAVEDPAETSVFPEPVMPVPPSPELSTAMEHSEPARRVLQVVGNQGASERGERGAQPAYTRTIHTHAVTFPCARCERTVTQQRFPGARPVYCSDVCKQEAQRQKTLERVRRLRDRRRQSAKQPVSK